jgi:hypothetical protein
MEQHYRVLYQNGHSHQYWFVSLGKKKIIKCVEFQSLGDHSFNLCLLDYIPEINEMSDVVVSNNGDMKKVLWTVARCAEHFLNQFPNDVIVFSGNSHGRNKLYLRYINRYREKLFEDYFIKIDFKRNNEIVFYIQKKIIL